MQDSSASGNKKATEVTETKTVNLSVSTLLEAKYALQGKIEQAIRLKQSVDVLNKALEELEAQIRLAFCEE